MDHAPTSDKPQSKLWHNDDLWWAVMFHSASQTWRIYRLDRASETWVDTGVVADERDRSLSDVLWDGNKLYIASHSAIENSEADHRASQSGVPARLYRYSYNSSTDRYTVDSGFPTQINNFSSESLTIDKDSTGRLWATWTQVTESTPGVFTAKVYVNHTTDSDGTWSTPAVLDAGGAENIDPDDISSVVAYGTDHIGLMWSNQRDDTMYWAWRKDTDAPDAWHIGVALRTPDRKEADDHINLKAMMSDGDGRVFAVTKTSLDQQPGRSGSDAQIRLLVFKPGTGAGAWSSSTFGTVADCHSRPVLVLDQSNQMVHVFATGPDPTVSGCPFTGTAGTIYMKSASMSNPVFPSGRGTPVIRDASAASGSATSSNVNNPTSTKQPVSNGTGLVVLASSDATETYWHADLKLPGALPTAAPESSFTATPQSGNAPLTVQFTDTSTQNPTGWSWDFGDGSTSTVQSPSHTYANPGTYTVTLAASNAAGADTTPATRTITVVAPPESSFTATPQNGNAPLTVKFTDTSTNNPTGWSWDFGDGSTSTAQNPSHTYANPGNYTVTLNASNAAGVDATPASTTITVVAPPESGFTATPQSGHAPLTVKFTDTSTRNPTGWSWDFGDGSTSTAQNPSHTYTKAGSYTVTLAASNAAGVDATPATRTISVDVAVDSVDLIRSRAKVVWPARVRLTGVVRGPAGEPLAGRTVELWEQGFGESWHLVGTETSSPEGTVSMLRRPAARTTYEWRSEGVSSPRRSVTVVPALSAQVNRTSASVNGGVVIRGRSTPTRVGTPIRLERWSPTKGWIVVRRKTFRTASTATSLSHAPRYSFTVRQRWSARTKYRVVVATDAGRRYAIRSGITVRWYRAAMIRHRASGNEYVTLKNTGKVRIQVSGWTITNKKGKVLRIKARSLGPGGAFRIHPRGGRTTKRDMYLGRGASFWPHDRLVLRDKAGVVVAVRRW